MIMKSFVILSCIAALTVAQRPSYAGLSSKVYPELASRFKDTESDSGSSSSSSSSSSNTNTIVNRIGEGETNPQTTIKIPIDARGDEELVKWLNTWPRENRPFWLLNAEHIEKFRDPEGVRNKEKKPILTRSFFTEYPSEEFEFRPSRPSHEIPSFFNSLSRK